MKKRDSISIIVVILLVLSLSACQSDESEKGQNQSEAKKKEDQTEESPEERTKRIESGEGHKSGEYGITLNTAYSEMNAFRDSQTAKPYVVQAVVRVRNVTEDQTLNAGKVGFEWNDPDFEKTRWKIEDLETFE
ncbi:hypothetical protein ERJ70_16030 [Sediminibacillus dalangtanensis]|uniref:DUF4352 domain-containing protein n=1 Tax=Sediminibacillus dalangtanensis TaxID=2729421 RepID=A0ABX7VYH8_9BACI|nr:hypothetical protein [Sediminibacillus dalangtanensis]QTN00664.1 hypothetical protein ERJ70_16030 [Sediminibacillus dalangtanensis]